MSTWQIVVVAVAAYFPLAYQLQSWSRRFDPTLARPKMPFYCNLISWTIGIFALPLMMAVYAGMVAQFWWEHARAK